MGSNKHVEFMTATFSMIFFSATFLWTTSQKKVLIDIFGRAIYAIFIQMLGIQVQQPTLQNSVTCLQDSLIAPGVWERCDPKNNSGLKKRAANRINIHNIV